MTYETSLRRQLLHDLPGIQKNLVPYIDHDKMCIPLAERIHAWAGGFLTHLQNREFEGREKELLDTYKLILIKLLKNGKLCEHARIAPNLEVLNPSEYKKIWDSDPIGFKKRFMTEEKLTFIPARRMLREVAKFARLHFPKHYPDIKAARQEEKIWGGLIKEMKYHTTRTGKIFEETYRKSHQEGKAREKQRKRNRDSWDKMKSDASRKSKEGKDAHDDFNKDLGDILNDIQNDFEDTKTRCDDAEQAMKDLNSAARNLEGRISDYENTPKKSKKMGYKRILLTIALNVAAGYIGAEYLTWKF